MHFFLFKKISYAGYKDCINYGVYDEVVSLSHFSPPTPQLVEEYGGEKEKKKDKEKVN
jgi:hypothetical protein